MYGVAVSTLHGKGEWEEYYRATVGRPPSHWFTSSMAAIDGNHGNGRLAIDLGCGNGVETNAFLDRGWRVHAIDREPAAIEHVRTRVDADELPRLTAQVAEYSDVELPAADLVFAQLSLPFCPPEVFPELWAKVSEAVVPGGHFVGQFLGPEDDWSGEVITHTVDEVRALFEGWTIVDLADEQHEGVAGARREPKYWHIVSVIARRGDPRGNLMQ